MNLPHNSMDFFETALDVIENGSIHLYRIVEEGEMMNTLKEMIEIAENHHRKIEITGTREVHNYSPTQSVMVFDIRVLG
jgi:tRNA G37 N-methylase Trm5